VSLSSVKRYVGKAERGESLAPKKRPGSNRAEGLRAFVSAPSYSPDYNPIEEAFAKIKNLLCARPPPGPKRLWWKR